MGEIGEVHQEVQISSYKISYGDIMYSISNIVNNTVITLNDDNGNQTWSNDHLIMYTNIELLCCTPETNITLYVNYSSIKYIHSRVSEDML